jgi:hypothetical protein
MPPLQPGYQTAYKKGRGNNKYKKRPENDDLHQVQPEGQYEKTFGSNRNGFGPVFKPGKTVHKKIPVGVKPHGRDA